MFTKMDDYKSGYIRPGKLVGANNGSGIIVMPVYDVGFYPIMQKGKFERVVVAPKAWRVSGESIEDVILKDVPQVAWRNDISGDLCDPLQSPFGTLQKAYWQWYDDVCYTVDADAFFAKLQ